MTDDTETRRSIRWWPAALVVAGGAIALTVFWWGDVEHRQGVVMMTQGLLLLVGGLLLVWFFAFSRLTFRARLRGLAALLIAAAGFVAMFEQSGVDGDLIPVFRYRWRSQERVLTGVTTDASTVRGDHRQFQGALRDGVVEGVRLETDWDAHPPELIWRRPVGAGWSGFAVAGDRAVTLEQHGDAEHVVCYELLSGDVAWTHAYEARYTSTLAGDGPRTTPTIDGGHVFTMGATGVLSAVEVASGRVLWSKNVLAEAGVEWPRWGASGSPLLVDGKVVVSVGANRGRSLVAFDRATGEEAWSGGDDEAGYGSPFVATLAGTPQILIFNHASVASHDMATGAVLWSQEWSSKQPNVAQPLLLGDDRLLITSGYGSGSRAYRVSRGDDATWSVEYLWRSARMKSKFSNMISYRESIFGLDDGALACLDAASGRRRWKQGRYGHGQMLRVGDVLLIMGENGDAILVAADPAEPRELARHTLIEGKVWNPPSLAGALLLVRNDSEAALFKLTARSP